MNSEPHAEAEFMSQGTTDDSGSASCGGSIFSDSQHFVVGGGTFTNITAIAPSMPHESRMIPLGDIDLQREVFLNNTGVINHQPERARIRRLYTAKIVGRKSDVAVYQGEGAQEEWREDIHRYSWLRHPNYVQLSRFATSSTMHVAVFNDDLMLLEHFLDLYHHLPIFTVCIHGLCSNEFGV